MTYTKWFESIEDFQRATLGGRGETFRMLEVDGIMGPNTMGCKAMLPYLSPHFRASEFTSNGDGRAHIRREVLAALEVLRARKEGSPLNIVSGYRDPAHNKKVGGASKSQHMQGLAVDIPTGYILTSTVLSLRLFSGIGSFKIGRTNWVRHLDLRHLGPWSDGATPTDPAQWSYN